MPETYMIEIKGGNGVKINKFEFSGQIDENCTDAANSTVTEPGVTTTTLKPDNATTISPMAPKPATGEDLVEEEEI